MKQRIITAACLIAVVLPLLYLGGVFTKILISLVSILATLEFVNNVIERKNRFYYPFTVVFAACIICGVLFKEFDFAISASLIIILFFFNVYFEEFDVLKIAYLYFMERIMVIGLDCFVTVREMGLNWVLYILCLTYVTDSFALIGGMKFGKHKLNERISPKKTIEGALCGYLSGVLVGIVFAFFILNNNAAIAPSLIIPVVSQLGDLAFSSIKRYFKIKDFSNIFPGHGGMLDRIDSLIFALITLSIFAGAL